MAKPFDVGLYVGRFQHVHIGHEHVIDTALRLCDRVLILVGSAQESGTERNPFNVATRIELIREIYNDDKEVIVKALPDLTNENDITPEWGRYVLSEVKKHILKLPDLMIYGNDEARSRWFDPEDIKYVSEHIISRNRIPISATQMRKFLVDGDFTNWMLFSNPHLHKHYLTIRSELLTVPWYQNLEVKK